MNNMLLSYSHLVVLFGMFRVSINLDIKVKFFKKSNFIINKKFLKYLSGLLYIYLIDLKDFRYINLIQCGVLFYIYHDFLYICENSSIGNVIQFINLLDLILISFMFLLNGCFSSFAEKLANKSTSAVLLSRGELI